MILRHQFQEFWELGWARTLFRVSWELRQRLGMLQHSPPAEALSKDFPRHWKGTLPFVPLAVAQARLPFIVDNNQRQKLNERAQKACRGVISCFGAWDGDFGSPIAWNKNPKTQARWPSDVPWSKALQAEPTAGDIKLTWELGRFPHAYEMARAAAIFPESRKLYAAVLASQIEDFVNQNPVGRGVHWYSGLEIALRGMAWLFASHVFGDLWEEETKASISRSLIAGAFHIEKYFPLAKNAIYNDHLLGEALALYLVGNLFPDFGPAKRWARLGKDTLLEQAEKQFYPDGAYLLHSMNYQRAATQLYLWAVTISQIEGTPPPKAFLEVLRRSVDFLYAHQNPIDGTLPNFGGNDGAQFHVLSSCAFSDFRPTLQAANLLANGERLYEEGAWDEEALWLAGEEVLRQPIKAPPRKSRSFGFSGYHVMRGFSPETFSMFRCGSLRERFSQMDMLHLDVWWKGLNVLVDGGSFQYNGADEWNNHFVRTASHNTVMVDGRDQMVHHRRFKLLYWTKAKMNAFAEEADFVYASGEHFGYRRNSGRCTHRREVLFWKHGVWVVRDSILGTGNHSARVHWLGGDYPGQAKGLGVFALSTPAGEFCIVTKREDGSPLEGNLIKGGTHPPRGWLSRHYGEKVSVPSIEVTQSSSVPLRIFSFIGPGPLEVSKVNDSWMVKSAQGEFQVRETDEKLCGISIPSGL